MSLRAGHRPARNPRASAAWFRLGFVMLVLGLLVPSAAAHPDHSTGTGSTVDYRFIVEGGEGAELNMTMMAGGSIGWEVESLNGRSFYLDLHSRSGNEVEYHEEFPSTLHESGVFTAPRDGRYIILVEREDPGDVEVRLLVTGDFDETGREGIEPLEDEPQESALSWIVVLTAWAAVVLIADRRRTNVRD